MKAFFGVLVLALIQASLAQYIRIAPDCGCNGPIINPCNPCNPCNNIIAPINPCNNIINPCNNLIAPINPCNNIINPCNPCSNIINPCNPIITAPVIPSVPVSVIQTNSVANSLADTLSLLTVSSLLADSLPLGSNIVAPGCGCGCGCYGPIYY